MTWNDITVEQYQRIAPIMAEKGLNGLERETKIIALLSGMTEDEFDAVPYEHYTELRKEYKFLHETEVMPGNAVRVINANGKRYRVQHDLRKVPISRYVEVKHYSAEQFVGNLHLIIASIIKPEKGEYNVKEHEQYAEDFKKAKFIDCYHTGVFFWELFNRTIISIPDYLESRLIAEGQMTPSQAKESVRDLCTALAGYITSNKLQTLKILR
jgi:hypothetical protein